MDASLFLPDELLTTYHFFELYPFDGGGYFIQKQLVGSLDDCAITDRILGGALNDFGPLERLEFTRFENWRSIEKSCWINRMYFLVSMARCAMLRKDTSLARKVLNIIRYFNVRYPAPATGSEVRALNADVDLRRDRDYNRGMLEGEVPYQWYDFQPASRIVNGLNAMNFLRDFDLPQEDFLQFIETNAEVINAGEDELHWTSSNHQTLRGLALLMAGRFLKNDEYVQRGNLVWNRHMEEDFYEDGMNVDMSPSYHVFEAWIGREGKRLGTMTDKAARKLDRALEVCAQMRQPDGKSLVLNDGYSLTMEGFLRSIGREPQDRNEETECVLPQSGIAIARTHDVFAVLDSTPCVGRYAHFHAGKNGLTLWLRQQPFLIDAACCSYDDDLFQNWFKQPQAHSTLLVNGKGDGTLRGRYEWTEVTHYDMGTWNHHQITCSTNRWTRTLTLAERNLTVRDDVTLNEDADLELIFNLHPDVTVDIQAETILLRQGTVTAQLSWKTEEHIRWHLKDGLVFLDDEVRKNQRLICACKARNWSMECQWKWLEN